MRFLKTNAKNKQDVEDITENGVFGTYYDESEKCCYVWMPDYNADLIVKGYNYSARAALCDGAGAEISDPVTVKMAVKATDRGKIKPSTSLKASGSVDVLAPNRFYGNQYDNNFIVLTPTIKNGYRYLDVKDYIFFKTVGKTTNEVKPENLPFETYAYNGTLVIWYEHRRPINTATEKYSVAIRAMDLDGHQVKQSNSVTLNFKQGSAKIQTLAPVSLVSTDRFSSAVITIKPVREDYKIASAKLDAASAKLFQLKPLEGVPNQWVLSYKDNRIPAGLKPGSSKSVKINVFFDGNETNKANLSTTVKVSIK